MKWLIGAIVIGIVLMALIARAQKSKSTGSAEEQPKAKRLLSEREQSMFNRLTDALPTEKVLAQVSLGALLYAQQTKTKNTFSQKIADFVICNNAFEVLAVIELDDASHKGKRDQDQRRDQMLASAGYKTLRYANVPDKAQLQKDFAPLFARARSRNEQRKA